MSETHNKKKGRRDNLTRGKKFKKSWNCNFEDIFFGIGSFCVSAVLLIYFIWIHDSTKFQVNSSLKNLFANFDIYLSSLALVDYFSIGFSLILFIIIFTNWFELRLFTFKKNINVKNKFKPKHKTYQLFFYSVFFLIIVSYFVFSFHIKTGLSIDTNYFTLLVASLTFALLILLIFKAIAVGLLIGKAIEERVNDYDNS